MNAPAPPLARTCRGCGLEKPLSAFLQLTGAHGTNYGTLCSVCRAAGRKAPAATSEDSTNPGGVGGSGIRGKEKLALDVQHIEEIIALNRFYLEEEKKDLAEQAKKVELLSDLHELEEKNRNAQPQKTIPDIKPAQSTSTTDKTQRILHAARASFAEQVRVGRGAEEKRHIETNRIISETEHKKASTDFNTLTEAIAPGKIEYQGEGIRHLMNWLGGDSKISRAIRGLPSKTATSEVAARKIAETITDGPDQRPSSHRSK